MTSGVSMRAMTRNVPPHTAQCSLSGSMSAQERTYRGRRMAAWTNALVARIYGRYRSSAMPGMHL